MIKFVVIKLNEDGVIEHGICEDCPYGYYPGDCESYCDYIMDLVAFRFPKKIKATWVKENG
jgi:hypothetical protein